LLRPGRTVIDSAGIRLPRHRRPRDRGSDETDGGQYDRAEFVFGVSGAAMMLRRAALADLAVGGEVVDEDFFAYHDDTDLCWRANRLGWRVLYEPRARGVHGCRWQRQQRMEIAPRAAPFVQESLSADHQERTARRLLPEPAVAAHLGAAASALRCCAIRDPAAIATLVTSRRRPR
jgi:cellulose synthase/poly-beta-1,6-N-acetylglucosamine synthase-like glycosyltransferase